jgi:hypothetical protein
MAGQDAWGRFGWHGMAFDVPFDWCPGRLEGDFKNGYVRIEDESDVRAELRWETAGRRVAPASKFVDNYIAQVRKKTRRKDPNPRIERDRCVNELGDIDHEVFSWHGAYCAHSLLAVCPRTRRVVHLRVFFDAGDERRAMTRRIFASLTTGPRHGLAEWSAFGFRFLVGDDWKLDTSGLRTGCLQFTFAHGDDELEVTRFSLAAMVLRKTTLAKWVPSTYHKAMRKYRVAAKEGEFEGCPAVRCEGVMKLTARPFGLFRRRRRLRLLAWHDAEADRVFAVRLSTLTPEDPQLEAIAATVSDTIGSP